MGQYAFRRFVNMLGFVSSILIALASLIAMLVALAQGEVMHLPGLVFSGAIGTIMSLANILAYFIVLVAGYSYARSKRSAWYMVAQVVSTLVILVMIILSNVL
ncbi:MAG: hypothetical protein IKC79_01080 [Clostridia bacterium]|nr:hypothetical protein [Clostridia bacterium]